MRQNGKFLTRRWTDISDNEMPADAGLVFYGLDHLPLPVSDRGSPALTALHRYGPRTAPRKRTSLQVKVLDSAVDPT
jgi:hypothetical protein